MGKIISGEFQVPGLARKDHNDLHVVNQEEVEPGHHVTTHCRLSTVISTDHSLTLCFFDINKVHMFLLSLSNEKLSRIAEQFSLLRYVN